MKRIFLVKNLSSIMFSMFLFLFAIEQALENINILYYFVLVLMMLCVALGLFSSVKSLVKDKQNFILNLNSKSIFSYLDAGSVLIGLIISYSLNSNLFKLWIFLLVITVITILMPHLSKKNKV
jgi:hypothetical protein